MVLTAKLLSAFLLLLARLEKLATGARVDKTYLFEISIQLFEFMRSVCALCHGLSLINVQSIELTTRQINSKSMFWMREMVVFVILAVIYKFMAWFCFLFSFRCAFSR